MSISDDGQPIIDSAGYEVETENYNGLVLVRVTDGEGSGQAAALRLFKARLFAHRILKLCDEIEGK